MEKRKVGSREKSACPLSQSTRREREMKNNVIDAIVGKLKEGSTHEGVSIDMQVKMTTRWKLSRWRSINGRRINAEYLNNKTLERELTIIIDITFLILSPSIRSKLPTYLIFDRIPA